MYKTGVLHRDVSLGNITLQQLPPDTQCSTRQMVSETRGVLIDLDHAKVTSGKMPISPGSLSSLTTFQREFMCSEAGVFEDAVVRAWQFYPNFFDAGHYIMAAKKSHESGTWSSSDFGWKDVGQIPDFRSHQPDNHERTGTLPFMSHQLLNPRRQFHHDAIHDMESFWWILVHLCLTRESGGARLRKDAHQVPGLHDLVEKLFEVQNLATIYSEKIVYFWMEDDIAFNDLLAKIHDYFKPLASLLKRWRTVLLLGYKFKAYEYHLIHDYVLIIITKRCETLISTCGLLKRREHTVIEEELQRKKRSMRLTL